MSDHVQSAVFSFLRDRYKKDMSVLLGFSGGPDSLALLHALLEFRQECPLRLALAHIDHGWRVESGDEANQIASMAERLGLPLHTKKLSCSSMKGNLEAMCREERLKFFAHLCREHAYEAVLLGHHGDDQAETVLKRLLEGSSVAGLGGIRHESHHNGLKVWRPLLSVTKKQILGWLQQKGVEGFNDKTNEDPKYLRARMRVQGIPFLTDMFGKEISGNLRHIGNESAEIREYLDEKVAHYLSNITEGPWGYLLDLSHTLPESKLELKHLIRRYCEMGGMLISREALGQSVEYVMKGSANKQFISGNREEKRILYIDRRRLFLLTSTGSGCWKMSIVPFEGERNTISSDWRHIWGGFGEVVLPIGKYYLSDPKTRSTSLDKWWTGHKVPSFLRYFAPVVSDEQGVVHEFLTGKVKKLPVDSTQFVKIKIELDRMNRIRWG